VHTISLSSIAARVHEQRYSGYARFGVHVWETTYFCSNSKGKKTAAKIPNTTQHNPGKIINRNTQGNDSYFTAKDDWI